MNRQHQRAFTKVIGRPPKSQRELDAWMAAGKRPLVALSVGISVVFEVRGNLRLLDNVPMPQPMPDGFYWASHDPKHYGLCIGPFADPIAAGLDLHRAMEAAQAAGGPEFAATEGA
jgi:hypothetical protein